jgi:hypothetical protein
MKLRLFLIITAMVCLGLSSPVAGATAPAGTPDFLCHLTSSDALVLPDSSPAPHQTSYPDRCGACGYYPCADRTFFTPCQNPFTLEYGGCQSFHGQICSIDGFAICECVTQID